MSTDLTIWTAAKEVSSALAAVISNYRSLRTVRKKDWIALEESIRLYKHQTRAHNDGDLVRTNIEEIAKTQRAIAQEHFTGIALDMAMGQLYNLNDLLNENLRRYRSA